MLRGRKPLALIVLAGLWVLATLACSTFSVSLDQATLRIAIPTPVSTKMPLPPGATFFEVQADQGWQDTGLLIRAGQRFQVTYVSGHAVDQNAVIEDGTGWDYMCDRASCCEPLPTARRGALIGRVDHEIFFLGNGAAFSAQTDGHLFLRINDCDEGLYDNGGSLKVGISP